MELGTGRITFSPLYDATGQRFTAFLQAALRTSFRRARVEDILVAHEMQPGDAAHAANEILHELEKELLRGVPALPNW